MNCVSVILWFVEGWWREPLVRTWRAIRRLLEKSPVQSRFSLIKWITAAKAKGWSSTFAKEFHRYRCSRAFFTHFKQKWSLRLGSNQLFACSSRSDSGKYHSPLSGSSPSCSLLSLAQILAESPLSFHDSPFFVHEQDTVGTFPAPPEPTGKVSCPLATPLPSSLPSQSHMNTLLLISVWPNKKTHNPWVRLASSQALGLFSEKTKRYMTYHRNVIYNPSSLTDVITYSSKELNHKLTEMGWYVHLHLGGKPQASCTHKQRSPGQDQLNRN